MTKQPNRPKYFVPNSSSLLGYCLGHVVEVLIGQQVRKVWGVGGWWLGSGGSGGRDFFIKLYILNSRYKKDYSPKAETTFSISAVY